MRALTRGGRLSPGPTPAQGGTVRTFVNPLLRESIKAHAASHPAGQYFFTGALNLCGNCHRAGAEFVLTPSGSFK